MPKHHKKPSPAQQKIFQATERRKDFFQRFERIITIVSGKRETFRTLPPRVLDHYYTYRFQALRVEAAQGHNIHVNILSDIKALSIRWLRQSAFTLNNNSDTLTLHDFLSVGMTLLIHTNQIEDILLKTHPDLVAAIRTIKNDKQLTGSILVDCMIIGTETTLLLSNMLHAYYWLDFDWGMGYDAEGNQSIYPLFKIFSHVQERKHLLIEGSNHPVVRVGWGFYPKGMDWCTREPALFGMPQSTTERKLPVYIQMHALQRLAERLDCVVPANLTYYIYLAANEGRITKGQNGGYLIDFHINSKKTGYLLAKVHAGKLVIRTFLFLTHNGTPEGNKLQALIGLGKDDKKYLSLDKLSTFLDPEIRQNETLRRLFIDAGCGDLFEITNNHMYRVRPVASSIKAEELMHFLMLKPIDPEAPPDFSDALAHRP
jgi:hypothetical protein